VEHPNQKSRLAIQVHQGHVSTSTSTAHIWRCHLLHIQAIKQQEVTYCTAEIEQIENGERKMKWGAKKSSNKQPRTKEEEEIENGEGD
jgi:hypothetical protein